jgi:hypothetical protein
VVVSNLFDGFDCYDIDSGEHLTNLPTPIIQNVPLPSVFIEDDQSILCGSSCGYALIYSGDMKSVIQVLRHGGASLDINAAAMN